LKPRIAPATARAGKRTRWGESKRWERASFEHRSPTGRGAECRGLETTAWLREDDAGHADGGLNHDGLDDVGEDVAEEDAQAAGAEGSRGVDVFTVADGHDLGSNQARVSGPAADGEGQYKVGEAGAEEGGKGDGEKDAGEARKVFMAKVVRAVSIHPPR